MKDILRIVLILIVWDKLGYFCQVSLLFNCKNAKQLMTFIVLITEKKIIISKTNVEKNKQSSKGLLLYFIWWKKKQYYSWWLSRTYDGVSLNH